MWKRVLIVTLFSISLSLNIVSLLVNVIHARYPIRTNSIFKVVKLELYGESCKIDLTTGDYNYYFTTPSLDWCEASRLNDKYILSFVQREQE
jgi:hypothetical protein